MLSTSEDNLTQDERDRRVAHREVLRNARASYVDMTSTLPLDELIERMEGSNLTVEGSSEKELRDRFVRYLLHTKYGPNAVKWNPRRDEVPREDAPTEVIEDVAFGGTTTAQPATRGGYTSGAYPQAVARSSGEDYTGAVGGTQPTPLPVRANAPGGYLHTGQSFGPWSDPIEMQSVRDASPDLPASAASRCVGAGAPSHRGALPRSVEPPRRNQSETPRSSSTPGAAGARRVPASRNDGARGNATPAVMTEEELRSWVTNATTGATRPPVRIPAPETWTPDTMEVVTALLRVLQPPSGSPATAVGASRAPSPRQTYAGALARPTESRGEAARGRDTPARQVTFDLNRRETRGPMTVTSPPLPPPRSQGSRSREEGSRHVDDRRHYERRGSRYEEERRPEYRRTEEATRVARPSEERRGARPRHGSPRRRGRRSSRRASPSSSRSSASGSTSSSEELWYPVRSARRSSTRAIDALRKYEVRFKDGSAADAERFIGNLERCMEGARLTWEEVEHALPVVLSGAIGEWYLASSDSFDSLRQFCGTFLRNFGRRGGNEARWEEARRCIQEDSETLSRFLCRIRPIFRAMKPIPSLEAELDRVYRNLRPEYRRLEPRQAFTSYKDFEDFGLRMEDAAEMDREYKVTRRASRERSAAVASTRAKEGDVRKNSTPRPRPRTTTASPEKEWKTPRSRTNRREESRERSSRRRGNRAGRRRRRRSYGSSDSSERESPRRREQRRSSSRRRDARVSSIEYRSSGEREAPRRWERPREPMRTPTRSPARRYDDVVCFQCNRRGHFAAGCPERVARSPRRGGERIDAGEDRRRSERRTVDASTNTQGTSGNDQGGSR